MRKLKRILMGILLLSFATIVKANYYIAEKIGTNNGGDATTIEEERTPVVPPTTEADDNTKKALEQGSEKDKPKEEKKTVDTGTMPATQTEDISTEAKYNSYANYENATLAKKSSSATFRMAQLYFRDGLYEKAVNLALKDENQAEAKLGIGIAYKSKGDFSKALGYLKDYNSKHSDDEVKKEIAVLNEILAGSR